MRAPLHRCRLRVFADYFQFYVWDPLKGNQEAPEEWSEQDVANRAKIAPGVVVICPVRNMEVPVEVGIWTTEPLVVFDTWQHVIEAPLVTSGQIEIHECTGGSLALFNIEPGEYTVRALYRGLDTLSEDGLKGDDFYTIQIWKAPCSGLQVIRRWNGKADDHSPKDITCAHCNKLLAVYDLVSDNHELTPEQLLRQGAVPVPNFGWFCSQECGNAYSADTKVPFQRDANGKIRYY